MFSMGISAGSCGGFLSVCCVKPVTINRWLHDNRLNDGFNEDYKAQRDRHREPGVINDPKCGVRPSANRRVIDGTDAGFGTFPWQALIRIGKAKVSYRVILVIRSECVVLYLSVAEFWSTDSTW